jgi:two-component system, NtrC family, response regulator AtoC
VQATAVTELDLPATLCLLVISREGVASYSLPREGRVSIGRGEGNTIRVEEGSVSRQHALLHVGPSGELRIEDLGGANGTSVQLRSQSPHGQTESLKPLRRESAAIRAGDRIVLGSVSAIVARQEKGAAQHAAAPIVCDQKMKGLYGALERAAASTINVLLLGETGVGKEVLARFLHGASRCASGPFVALNCAALPESLLEAELFGHERGAFTGATQARPGLFEAADGGTLFLDEVGELPLTTQAKLLRVLEERQVVRVGGRTERPFDARFVSATNRDLEHATDDRNFRSDLYFRLAGLVLTIPPLRERPAEVLPMARGFLDAASAELDRQPLHLAPDALVLLEAYAWPGNIRELKNAMQRAAALARGSQVCAEHLPERLLRASPGPHAALSGSAVVATEANVDEMERLRGEMRAVERGRILEALEQCAGNQTRAAEQLGISRRTLLNRLQAYDLPRPRKV